MLDGVYFSRLFHQRAGSASRSGSTILFTGRKTRKQTACHFHANDSRFVLSLDSGSVDPVLEKPKPRFFCNNLGMPSGRERAQNGISCLHEIIILI